MEEGKEKTNKKNIISKGPNVEPAHQSAKTKQQLSRLEKYDAVNNTENLDELSNLILYFSDKDGMINGRIRKFDASAMASYCLHYSLDTQNLLTREFGIRQQAMMLLHYKNLGI